MKAYIIATLALLVVWAAATFVIGLVMEMLFPPPAAGAWLYWVAGGIGLLAGIGSFRATVKTSSKSKRG
jgi:hypothetical protein